MPEPREKPGEVRKNSDKKQEKPKTTFARFRVMLSGIFKPNEKKPDWPKRREEEKFFNWTMDVDSDER